MPRQSGAIGKVVPGYQAKVADDQGRELPHGEIGTLWVKGDSAALCYFGAHEKSKETLRGDWVVSGESSPGWTSPPPRTCWANGAVRCASPPCVACAGWPMIHRSVSGRPNAPAASPPRGCET